MIRASKNSSLRPHRSNPNPICSSSPGACAGLWVQADLGVVQPAIATIPRSSHDRYTSLINSAAGVEAAWASAWASASASARLAPGNLGVVQQHLSRSYEQSDLIRF